MTLLLQGTRCGQRRAALLVHNWGAQTGRRVIKPIAGPEIRSPALTRPPKRGSGVSAAGHAHRAVGNVLGNNLDMAVTTDATFREK